MLHYFDVAIIGGGVVGSAIARELSRYDISIAVLEENPDVVCEASGRNSAVVHGGFAYDRGSLKARLCVEGNQMMDELSSELGFRFIRCGKVLVGNTEDDLRQLERTMAQGFDNGATGLELIDGKCLHSLVPAVNGAFAMLSRNSGILDPFLFTINLAENAAMNGVKFFLSHKVQSLERNMDRYILHAGGEDFSVKWVVNAAGKGAKTISDMLGITGYKVIGSKGNYLVLDKRLGPLLPMPVYPVPSNTYMGIHVTPTVDGNVTVGPDAVNTDDFEYYGVPAANMEYLRESASLLWPHIDRKDVIRTFSGILSKWVDAKGVIQDFRIEIRDDIAPNAVNLIGIESPGLTAAVPIARYVISLMLQRTDLKKKRDFNPVHSSVKRFAAMSDDEKARAIDSDSRYGRLVCSCEQVTEAEIINAIHNTLGVHTITGIKYRTRAMMGNCQAGFCQMKIESLIEQELGIRAEDVRYLRESSWVLTGKMREC